MDAHRERRAKNESLFRDVNERIAVLEHEFQVADLGLFVCECDRLECNERFPIPLPEYEELRRDPTTFAVLPGHESSDVEDVVRDRGEYLVVRKRPGEPARIAIEDAPR